MTLAPPSASPACPPSGIARRRPVRTVPRRATSLLPTFGGAFRSRSFQPLRGHQPPRHDTGDERGATAPLGGNRTTQTIGANTDSYTLSASSNRLTAINTSPPKSYAYDPNGSLTGDGGNTFAYDPRGRLVQSSTAAGTTSYRINALGQRIRKTNSTEDTLYHYDLQGRLIEESDPSGTPKRSYLYLDDLPLAVIQ